MDVGALGVGELAEHPRPDEVEDEALVPAVAAVLEDHAVPPRALGDVHEPPALLERDRGRDLDRGVDAVLHGRDRHRHVPAPRRRHVHEVEVSPLAEVLVVVVALRVALGLLLPGLDDRRLRPRHLLGHDVADRLHLDPVDPEEVVEEARPRPPQPTSPSRTLSRRSKATPIMVPPGPAAARAACSCAAPGRERESAAAAPVAVFRRLRRVKGRPVVVGHVAPPGKARAYARVLPQRKRSVSIPCFFTAYARMRSVVCRSRAARARLPRALLSVSCTRSFS